MNYFNRILRLLAGLFIFSIAIAVSIRANIGVAPWDVFHQGLGVVFNMTIGRASIYVGLVIVGVNFILKEKIGLGTLLNMVLIGLLLDWVFSINIIPISTNLIQGIVMLIVSMFFMAFASYLYIGSGFGAGPRDGFMVAMLKRTKLSVGMVRSGIEISALVMGTFMGGQLGIGTVILAFGIGPIIQLVFKCLKFDVKSVKHSYLIGNRKNT
jgi:uncharacterized membrane protein YczE